MNKWLVFLLFQIIFVWGAYGAPRIDIDTTRLIPIDNRTIIGKLETDLPII